MRFISHSRLSRKCTWHSPTAVERYDWTRPRISEGERGEGDSRADSGGEGLTPPTENDRIKEKTNMGMRMRIKAVIYLSSIIIHSFLAQLPPLPRTKRKNENDVIPIDEGGEGLPTGEVTPLPGMLPPKQKTKSNANRNVTQSFSPKSRQPPSFLLPHLSCWRRPSSRVRPATGSVSPSDSCSPSPFSPSLLALPSECHWPPRPPFEDPALNETHEAM